MGRQSLKTRVVSLAALAIFGLCGPAPAAAGEGSGKVEIEHVGFGTGLVFFFTAVHTDAPACNNYRKRWVLSTTTPEGKGQYAFILAAEATGKEIRVWGKHVCDLYGDSESIHAVGSIIDYSQHP